MQDALRTKRRTLPRHALRLEAPALHAVESCRPHEPRDAALRVPHALRAQHFGDLGILARTLAGRGVAPAVIAAARHRERLAQFGDGVLVLHRLHARVTLGSGPARMPKAFSKNVPLRPQALIFTAQPQQLRLRLFGTARRFRRAVKPPPVPQVPAFDPHLRRKRLQALAALCQQRDAVALEPFIITLARFSCVGFRFHGFGVPLSPPPPSVSSEPRQPHSD
jgi:hypothetical protein